MVYYVKVLIKFLSWWINICSILVLYNKHSHDNSYYSGLSFYNKLPSHIKQLSGDPKNIELQLKNFCNYTPSIPWTSISNTK